MCRDGAREAWRSGTCQTVRALSSWPGKLDLLPRGAALEAGEKTESERRQKEIRGMT